MRTLKERATTMLLRVSVKNQICRRDTLNGEMHDYKKLRKRIVVCLGSAAVRAKQQSIDRIRMVGG
jgi:hypothetical protein